MEKNGSQQKFGRRVAGTVSKSCPTLDGMLRTPPAKSLKNDDPAFKCQLRPGLSSGNLRGGVCDGQGAGRGRGVLVGGLRGVAVGAGVVVDLGVVADVGVLPGLSVVPWILPTSDVRTRRTIQTRPARPAPDSTFLRGEDLPGCRLVIVKIRTRTREISLSRN